ncbi:MAG: 5-formyltetrahydrofolate cyclo-ligase [Clostridiales Family XIII bacterium]|jgi:5-formyltetrahydrofolate cyclo-ligase|nr:5-formyltetrahydrofolate cyclo-ligase [Clostridiales Family XIII bacterium]
MTLKQSLRAELTERLRRLDGAYKAAADRAIRSAIVQSKLYGEAGVLFTYVGRNDEIDTLPLIEQALAEGKRVCAPAVRGGGVMDAKEIASVDDLTLGAMNLIEPCGSCPPIEPQEIELVLVPCISCDPCGNRLGYGGGYYDRYLKRLRPSDACSGTAEIRRRDARTAGCPDAAHDASSIRRHGVRRPAPFLVLCRERMLSQNLPAHPLDVRMDYCVTEAGVFPALRDD